MLLRNHTIFHLRVVERWFVVFCTVLLSLLGVWFGILNLIISCLLALYVKHRLEATQAVDFFDYNDRPDIVCYLQSTVEEEEDPTPEPQVAEAEPVSYLHSNLGR